MVEFLLSMHGAPCSILSIEKLNFNKVIWELVEELMFTYVRPCVCSLAPKSHPVSILLGRNNGNQVVV